MIFSFEIRDPRVIPGGFPWDPAGNEALAIASAQFLVCIYELMNDELIH